jgi:predicted transcriptional regulator
VKLTVRLPDSLVRRAKIQAIKRRTKFQALIERALETFLKCSGPEGDVQ